MESRSVERYSRQVLFPEIGEEGQRAIQRSSVLVVGLGALGSVSSDMLVRAGVGFLRLVDRDYVEETNLQRQSLYDEGDLEVPKAVAAVEKLRRVNGEVKVEGRVDDLNPDNAEELASDVDLIVDGTDNFETRYLINDISIKADKPWIYAACVGSYGMSFVIRPGKTPCLRCLMEEGPPPGSTPTCDTAGVIAPVAHAVVACQVAEALKLLAGREDMLLGSVISLDIWKGTYDRFQPLAPRKECPACGRRDYEYLSGKLVSRAATLCGRNAVQVRPQTRESPALEELAQRLHSLGPVKMNPHLLRFQIQGKELVVFADGRAIVHGTDDPSEARSLYARYVGR